MLLAGVIDQYAQGSRPPLGVLVLRYLWIGQPPGDLHTGVAEWRRCLRLIGHFLYASLIDWLFNSCSGNWPLVSFVIVIIIFDVCCPLTSYFSLD